jgi:hypothetical protein
MREPCTIEDCTAERRGRGLCAKHWARWRKHGDPTVALVHGRDYAVKGTCRVDDCGRPHHAHDLCSMHLVRWQKHGDPHIVGERLGRPLKGEVPGWHTIHKRLTRSRGPARTHQCADCGGQAAEWSYNGGDPDELRGPVGRFTLPYSINQDYYSPRCIRCHRIYDKAGEGRLRDHGGKFLPDERRLA